MPCSIEREKQSEIEKKERYYCSKSENGGSISENELKEIKSYRIGFGGLFGRASKFEEHNSRKDLKRYFFFKKKSFQIDGFGKLPFSV